MKERHLKQFHDRVLQVSVAVPKNTKRLATTIVQSASPEPSTVSAGADADADNDNSPASHSRAGDFSSGTPDPSSATTADTRRERTIALLNIPDTVNDARVRALVEPYGALRKIILRPDHQGAIIEFQSVQDVGKAALALEGREIVAGKAKIAVGTVEEMLRSRDRAEDERAEGARGRDSRDGRHGGGNGKGKGKGVGSGKGHGKGVSGVLSMGQSALVSRPGRPSLLGLGGRRGGKGGLGQRRGGGGVGGGNAVMSAGADAGAMETDTTKTDGQAEGASAPGGKSNAFFRSLLKKE